MQYAPGIPACPSWATAVIARKKHFSAPLTPLPSHCPVQPTKPPAEAPPRTYSFATRAATFFLFIKYFSFLFLKLYIIYYLCFITYREHFLFDLLLDAALSYTRPFPQFGLRDGILLIT